MMYILKLIRVKIVPMILEEDYLISNERITKTRTIHITYENDMKPLPSTDYYETGCCEGYGTKYKTLSVQEVSKYDEDDEYVFSQYIQKLELLSKIMKHKTITQMNILDLKKIQRILNHIELETKGHSIRIVNKLLKDKEEIFQVFYNVYNRSCDYSSKSK